MVVVVVLVKEGRLWRASVARDERRKPNAAEAMVNSEADSQAGRGGQRRNPRLRNSILEISISRSPVVGERRTEKSR